MDPFQRSHPDEAYPLSRTPAHDQNQLFTPVDPTSGDSTLLLPFDTDQLPLDSAGSDFTPSQPGLGTTGEAIDDLGLSPYPILGADGDALNDCFGHGQSAQASPAASRPRNGPLPPKAEPWTSVSVRGQSMTAPQTQQSLPGKPPHNSRYPDSGYEGSLQSASVMPYPRPARKGHGGLSDDALMDQMQDLPDQSLSSAMPTATRTHSKPRSTSVSTGNPDTQDKLDCPTCKTTYSTASEFQKHMARHEKKYKCPHPDCTRHAGFATTNDRDRHRKGVHGEIGLDDHVWKCFVPDCKSADKIWPRQDNFRAHIDRLHKTVDANEFVRISDLWFEREEKPRRLSEWTSPSHIDLQPDLGMGHFPQFSGAQTEHNYPSSMVDPSEYARSVATDLPDARHPPTWDLDLSSATLHAGNFMYSPSFAAQAQIPFTSLAESQGGFRQNPALSHTSMTHSGIQNDPPLPRSHKDNDFMDHLRDISMDATYLNYARPLKTRTLPDKERMVASPYPDWGFDTMSPVMDMPQTNPQIEFSFMGGEDTNPAIQLTEGGYVLSTDTPSSTDINIADPSASVDHLTDRHHHEIQSEFNQWIAKCSDRRLAQRLKESVAKTIQEYSSSMSAHTGTTSGLATADPSHDQSPSFTCSREGCRKTFAMKNRLTKHEKRHDKIFFCTFDTCYKRFGTKTDLSRHEYRVHAQGKAWRCWAMARSRDKFKKCNMLFDDEDKFKEHRHDCHSKIQLPLETFQIEPNFAGSFWCGFCNAVVRNPIEVDVDGVKRVRHRYQHIEQHMNYLYTKKPEDNAMDHWVELGSNGKTKSDTKNEGKPTAEPTQEDEDSDDDEDDGEDSTSRTGTGTHAGPPARPRALTETRKQAHGQFLRIPEFQGARKRAAEFPLPDLPASHATKIKKVPGPRSVSGVPHTQRHTSMGGTSGSTPPLRSLNPEIFNQVIAYIKCCQCPAPPRKNDGQRTCTSCWKPNCERCKYYNIDKQQLRMLPDTQS